ncbi:SPFH domain-containing protein [Calycomorphotria hydatis]|uniref:SPFH domain / Band 7 family protein n=1 Tax=Calycomorphotria hydatis TaxID=2528027 RepID=A0A517T4F8_9PLAN|nr:SPFH domain-containing protein [Calycomorphotria hydatis]QDT63251.1 SPFH domain / Band 7 family protein [Calycomorphotria hydatis]
MGEEPYDLDFTRRRKSQPFFTFARGGGTLVLAVILGAIAMWGVYTQFRIEVNTGEMAILIRKTGTDIKNAAEIAPGPEYKGVQRDFLKEGRYFKNPYVWDWQVIRQTEIPEGKLGVKISLTGDDLPYGEFLAREDENGNTITKGIHPNVLRPGRYPIHPYLFSVEEHDPVTIPAGYKGVVTNLAGKFPEDPNQLLVNDGERGVQKQTLDPGTYYVNPYVTRINLVDCRSQRFNLADNKDMGFPSKDGFWVSLDGIVEFRVHPEQAAEVYVIYNEHADGERIDEELIRKVIMPNARSFCRLEGSNVPGRDFIQGDTRTAFQDNFQKAMRSACEPLGIEIIQALITNIKPPEPIAKPVRDREIAKQQELQYQQQILQQEAEQNLAIEQQLVKQKQALVAADQDVVKVTTQALREQEVAVTKADERLAVSALKLEAAKDEAAAIQARGQAEADVIVFQNEAEAAGWKRAVEAFNGNGEEYARYVLFQKLSSAYREIMVNTADSPIMKIFESFNKPAAESPSVAGDGGQSGSADNVSARPASNPQ